MLLLSSSYYYIFPSLRRFLNEQRQFRYSIKKKDQTHLLESHPRLQSSKT